MTSSRIALKGINIKLLVIFTLIILSGVIFGGYSWWFSQQSSINSYTNDEKPANKPEPIFMDLEPFTVNLQGMNYSRDRVLYIVITVRLVNERSLKQLNEYLPDVRSRLLLLLSQQSPQILGTHEGKLQLMKAIKTTLTPTVVQGQPDQEISDVLFTTFILR